MKDFDDLRNPSPYDPVEPEPDPMDPGFRTDLRQASDFDLRQAEQGSSKVGVQNAIRNERYKREQMNNLGSETQFESDVVDGPGIGSDLLDDNGMRPDPAGTVSNPYRYIDDIPVKNSSVHSKSSQNESKRTKNSNSNNQKKSTSNNSSTNSGSNILGWILGLIVIFVILAMI